MRTRRRLRLLLSLALTAAIAAGVAWLVVPQVMRERQFAALASDDDVRFESALTYIKRRIADDAALAERAASTLSRLPMERMVAVLDTLLDENAMQHEAVAAQLFGNMRLCDADRFAAYVTTLDHYGEWRSTDVPPDVHLRWLSFQIDDPSPDARVLAAGRLADLHESADDPGIPPLLATLVADKEAEVRYMAIVAAAELAGAPAAGDNEGPLQRIVFRGTSDEEPVIQSDAWLLLGLLDPLSGFEANWRVDDPAVAQAVIFAAMQTNPKYTLPALEALDDAAVDPLIKMIAAYMLKRCDDEAFDPKWDSLIMATDDVNASKLDDLSRDELIAYMKHADSRVRDVACVVAAERFSSDENAELARELLIDFNDHARMSGAILAGLTGVRPSHTTRAGTVIDDLLGYRAENEDVWSTQRILELGLWMQGDRPGMDTTAPLLLGREDMPRSTLLLAMLNRMPSRALDYLLTPRGEERFPLQPYLFEYRWHCVLGYFLPANAPPLWPDARPELQQFQIDVLRNWYLVNRHKPGLFAPDNSTTPDAEGQASRSPG